MSKQVYRPPGARGAPSTFKLHDDDEQTTTSRSSSTTTTGPTAKKEENLSKTALKNKKKREAAKKRKDEEEVEGGESTAAHPEAGTLAANGNGYQGAAGLLFDAEKEKKIRKIMDKIKAIDQLKLIQALVTKLTAYYSVGMKKKQLLLINPCLMFLLFRFVL